MKKTLKEKEEMRREWLKRIIKEVANTRWHEEQKLLYNNEVSTEAIPLQYMLDYKRELLDYLLTIGEKQKGKIDVYDDLLVLFQDLAPALEYAITNAGAIRDGLPINVEPFLDQHEKRRSKRDI